MTNLHSTLKQLGISNPENLAVEVLAASEANTNDNEQVYSSANRYLLEVLEDQDLDHAIHITGEMRALSDPLHRKVCRAKWKRNKVPFRMVCYLPEEHRNSGRKIWQWNKKYWQYTSWVDHLDVFNLLGSEEVLLFAQEQSEPMHYSIFGDCFILLQAKHHHPTYAKDVWLLRSCSVASQLTQKAEAIVERSQLVHPRIFRQLIMSLTNSCSLSILFGLVEHGRTLRKSLGRVCRFDEHSADSCLQDLLTVGFVTSRKDVLDITPLGKEYLEFTTIR